MKVRITHLKSTGWPQGAQVGDVVDLKADSIPGWALGKCDPVADEAQASEAKPQGKSVAKKEPAQ